MWTVPISQPKDSFRAEIEGRSLIGPALGAPQNNGGRFTSEDFQIEVENRKAICTAGRENTQCSRLEDQQSKKVTFRFEWGQLCADCSLRERCVGTEQKHRTVAVGEHHTALQARRHEQKSESFKEQMKHRNGIEGSLSELVRGHGIRHTRYRGLAKVRLQNYFSGAACNLKRWLRRKIWEMSQSQAKKEAMAS